MFDHESSSVSLPWRLPGSSFNPNSVGIEQKFWLPSSTCARRERSASPLLVKFICDVTHNFFQHIFEGDDAARATVFVNHNGDVDFLIEILEAGRRFLPSGMYIGRAARTSIEVIHVQRRQKIFDVQDANDLVR